MRLETTIAIDRPVDEVMEYLTRIENLSVWAENIVEAGQTSQGPVGRGATYRIVSQVMGSRMSHDFTIAEFIPGQRYAARSVGGPFAMSVTYDIEPCEGGSRLRSVSEVRLKGLMAMAAASMSATVQAQFESDHRNLKRILES